MKTRITIILLGALSAACSAFGINQTEDKEIPKNFFPPGRHSADLYGGMMTPAGKGFVEFSEQDGGNIALTVITSEGKKYTARFSPDRGHCLFLGRAELDSQRDFSRSTAGALDERIERSWSSERYTVMIAYTFSDRMHVVYLRDRITNDPLLIAKFPPSDVTD